MTALSMANILDKLKDEYSGGVMYGHESLVIHGAQCIGNNGLMGSLNVVSLSSLDAIIHEAPGCIAAPLVNMIAKNAISLGMTGQGDQPVPVRLYAPTQLSITTKHLSVGELMILVEPKYGLVACKKLTLSKSTEEDPYYFEIVKSWAINDDMEVEVISTVSSKAEPKEASE